MQLSLVISSFTVGFYIEPKLAGIFIALFPIQMIIMAALVTNWMAATQKQSKAYAMSSGYSS
jgi:ABC-type sulfate transport system permease component